ncbi:hypothetical protein Lesp02_84120 [Lentzea sp. NBRC 105346]|uniref:AAA family ATPase n=1 Tax=Lentzea sp. NBRC 105346 TaxID=3032205 RepID=UPI0024A5465F|nr:AAA family ATPase [Lentzea sp. NBRC 105346]GLZ36225.1 hypothetical protein Lesp02_84120 [Lentzea sp. NBRC 105346]
MPVTLIAGPPCAGKTTKALELARPGDLVIDRDAIARQLGSSRLHMHTPYITRLAEQRMRAQLVQLQTNRGITAYVVRCLPGATQRQSWVSRFRARLVLLDPGIDECLHRARVDGRPPGTFAAIRQWYQRYQAQPVAEARPCMDCGRPALSARCKSCCERLRSGRPWRRLQAQVFSEETHCWICGGWVDQDLHADHAWSRTVDHLVQLRDGGDALDRANCRLAHRGCNTGRANKLRAKGNATREPLIVDPRSI